jgi:hypothetical protein
VAHLEEPAAQNRPNYLLLEICSAGHRAMGRSELCIGNRTGTSRTQSAADTVNNRAPQPLATTRLLGMIGGPSTTPPEKISSLIGDNGLRMALTAVHS